MTTPEAGRRGSALLLGTAMVALLLACTPDADDGPPLDDPASAPIDGLPPFPEDTSRQTERNRGDWDLVLTDVRVGAHEDFDRVVLEFAGTGDPGWTVAYADAAVLDGSARRVRLDGDAVLDVYATGATWPGAGYYSGPQRLEANRGGITDVRVGGTFEGTSQVLVGVDGAPAPFRVFALTGPPRVVVDVMNESDG